ncbi:hypothetical protein CSH63_01055 [Micromonospora tulbaghiae]|uniref:Uncharacterized protein n=1 Tax=Micromonospora tulbaghiae TaxID=479978 RepID=A0A386WEG0_9ACTN|nr:hypothetical protein [Micromonospora tulbaghiae]AYF26072.1 hypothetical protein CSH63_01055 [Micromonospora tulbaghiae]
MSLSPEERSHRARIAALARWSREDPRAGAQRGQEGLLNKFREQVAAEAAARGERVSGSELERRAHTRRREHMARLAYSRSKTARSQDTGWAA